ncbi:MAG: XTP/dITP diphosphatase [Acidobacteria bacterium]|nr:XTP/dITP diphosphatase [Acidobacteriota bacterium]
MKVSKLLVATKNPGKILELEKLLATTNLEILNLNNFSPIEDVEETGTTFEENALIKAQHYFQKTKILSLSDDSGLMVNILNGAPGLYSARYAGENASDKMRYEKLLHELREVPLEKRTAQFVCCLALVGDGIKKTFSASTQGQIIFTPRGENGFGYDPIFEYIPLSKTFAELSQEEKALVSHRGKALIQLRDYFTWLSSQHL